MMAHVAGLQELAELRVRCQYGPGDLRRIAGIRNLEFLDLGPPQVRALSDWTALVESARAVTRLPRLRRMRLALLEVPPEKLRDLEVLPAACELGLHYTFERLGPDELASMARIPSLQRLSLPPSVGDECLPLLEQLRQVRWLGTKRSGLSPRAIAALRAALPHARIE
jgi:hypothetical protein